MVQLVAAKQPLTGSKAFHGKVNFRTIVHMPGTHFNLEHGQGKLDTQFSLLWEYSVYY